MNWEAWMGKSKHLPAFMRDFHDQKRVFKWLDRAAQRQNAKNREEGYKAELYDHPDFRKAMTYTVDIFLWLMASHGYTLQRTRQKVEGLGDIDEALARFQADLDQQHREAWDRMMAERRAAAEAPAGRDG